MSHGGRSSAWTAAGLEVNAKTASAISGAFFANISLLRIRANPYHPTPLRPVNNKTEFPGRGMPAMTDPDDRGRAAAQDRRLAELEARVAGLEACLARLECKDPVVIDPVCRPAPLHPDPFLPGGSTVVCGAGPDPGSAAAPDPTRGEGR